jgi:rhodanese-related sulfurtransferase
VLTGDTLFIGDVGRPDLLTGLGLDPDVMAGQLYDSLHLKLMQLPDSTYVYPAHGAGSLCGRQLGDESVSTLGEQKAYNYALQPMEKEDFKRLVTADQPQAPKYFIHDSILNRKDLTSLDDSVQAALQPLDLSLVLEMQHDGVQLVDVRDAATFAAAHLSGALNIGLNGQYATWCGTLLDMHRPIVVIGDDDQIQEAIMRLGRIGFDQVSGYLQHGPKSLKRRPDLVRRVDRVTVRALSDQILSGRPAEIVDVRTAAEWKSGHIRNSCNLPLNELSERFDALDRDQTIGLYCQTGYRSSAAASLLLRYGFDRVMHIVGGFAAWTASGLPFETTQTENVY